jgi:hypothetical protein
MPFEDLIQFIERDMRMSHVYQPVMLRALLDRSGRASVQDVARALLNEDRSQLEYYFEITKSMVGRVLTSRAVVKRDGAEYELLEYDKLTPDQVQLNQTFTILVSLRAVERLIEMHPEANGFRLALATSSGRDIESVEPNLVASEVFSATHPGSNQKLKKDIARLASDPARHRYVFFAAPKYTTGRQAHLETVPGVEVHCVEL